jgi:hypothetical protein
VNAYWRDYLHPCEVEYLAITNKLKRERYHENEKFLTQYRDDESLLNSDEAERAEQLDTAHLQNKERKR